MQPQQPYQQPNQYPPTSPPNPTNGGYDFIMNPDKPPKKPGFSFGGGSLMKRVLLIVGAVFVAAILLAVVTNLTKNSGFDKAGILAVGQDQTEILRLVDLGETNAKSQALANFNATASASTTSDQTTLLIYMSTNKLKPNVKALSLKHDTAADTQLTTALSAGTFDTVYKSVLDKKLSEYQADLSAAYKKAGPKGQAILKAQFNNAKLLRTQLNS